MYENLLTLEDDLHRCGRLDRLPGNDAKLPANDAKVPGSDAKLVPRLRYISQTQRDLRSVVVLLPLSLKIKASLKTKPLKEKKCNIYVASGYF